MTDPLLRLPGVMSALWPSTCRGCEHRIAVGDLVGLADTDSGRAWVCRACLSSNLTSAVPAQRVGETTVEVAR